MNTQEFKKILYSFFFFKKLSVIDGQFQTQRTDAQHESPKNRNNIDKRSGRWRGHGTALDVRLNKKMQADAGCRSSPKKRQHDTITVQVERGLA
jgi:hypothetical protein